jgi:hypothetical protein
MTDFNPNLGKPYATKSGQADPDDVLREIMEEMPGSTEQQTWPLFRQEILKSDDLVEICLRRYHVGVRRRLYREATNKQSVKERKSRAAAKAEKVKDIFILDFIMPNGQRLRDCTFGYVRKVGGAFSKLGEMGKPNQVVGQILSNKQADAAVRSFKI